MKIIATIVADKPWLVRVDYDVLGVQDAFLAYAESTYPLADKTVKVYWNYGKGYSTLMEAAHKGAAVIQLQSKSAFIDYDYNTKVKGPKKGLGVDNRLINAIEKALVFGGNTVELYVEDMKQKWVFNALEGPISATNPLFYKAQIEYKLYKGEEVPKEHVERWNLLQELRKAFVRTYMLPGCREVTKHFRHEVKCHLAETVMEDLRKEEIQSRIDVLYVSNKISGKVQDTYRNAKGIALAMDSRNWLEKTANSLMDSTMYQLDRISVKPYQEGVANVYRVSDFIRRDGIQLQESAQVSSNSIKKYAERKHTEVTQASKVAEISVVYDYLVEHADELGVAEEAKQENRIFCKCGKPVSLYSEATLWRKYRQVFNQCLYCDAVYPPAEGEVAQHESGVEMYDVFYGTDPTESPELVLLAKLLKELADEGLGHAELRQVAEEFLS